MLILTNQISLYGKKVITDMATRSGNANFDDFSYCEGLSRVVGKYLPDSSEVVANLTSMFEKQEDFNPDVVHPQMTEEDYNEQDVNEEGGVRDYSPYADPLDFNLYYRRLEDIATPYLEKYLGNIVYSIRMNKDNGLREFDAKHRELPVMMGIGDSEGEFTDLADLQLMFDNEDWSLEEQQTATAKLPYVIKRLHTMSCYVGVHMLSYVAAYERAKARNIQMRNTGSTMILKKNAVIREGVYLCNKEGNITKRVEVQNKNKRAEEIFMWITGQFPLYKSYYEDYVNFVHYCAVLNIDIMNDDFSKYQKQFVDDLIVTTVTPNVQYDAQVLNAILNPAEVPVYVETYDESKALENIVNLFNQLLYTDPTLMKAMENSTATSFNKVTDLATSVYNMYTLLFKSVCLESRFFKWVNGFLCYNGEIVILPADFISPPDSDRFIDNRVIIHELGYCLHLSDLTYVEYMPIISAYNNAKQKYCCDNSMYVEKFYYGWDVFNS